MTALKFDAIFGVDSWYRFRRNPLSLASLLLVSTVVLLAILAPVAAPYPDHVGSFVDFANANQPPSLAHPFGTDMVGRDILSRVFFGYRISLAVGLSVILISAPVGVLLGLLAGYYGGWIDAVIMRITDVFLSIPPLVLAMAVLGFLEPTLVNGALAITVMWWPWYARLTYSLTRTIRREGYVTAALVVGASNRHILLREILPNCIPTFFTKMTLDLGFVILAAASLSFLGLGVQPPTPDLGSMVAEGSKYLPGSWWQTVFPALAILVAVLGFNLLGDAMRNAVDQAQ